MYSAKTANACVYKYYFLNVPTKKKIKKLETVFKEN